MSVLVEHSAIWTQNCCSRGWGAPHVAPSGIEWGKLYLLFIFVTYTWHSIAYFSALAALAAIFINFVLLRPLCPSVCPPNTIPPPCAVPHNNPLSTSCAKYIWKEIDLRQTANSKSNSNSSKENVKQQAKCAGYARLAFTPSWRRCIYWRLHWLPKSCKFPAANSCCSLCYPLHMYKDLQGMRNSFILYSFTLCRDISSLPKIVSQTALSVCPQSRRRLCPLHLLLLLLWQPSSWHCATSIHWSVHIMHVPCATSAPHSLSLFLHYESFITLTTHTVPPPPFVHFPLSFV